MSVHTNSSTNYFCQNLCLFPWPFGQLGVNDCPGLNCHQKPFTRHHPIKMKRWQNTAFRTCKSDINKTLESPRITMTTIDNLLANRETKRIGNGGNSDRARNRLELSKFLARHYVVLDELRTHLFHRHGHPLLKASGEMTLLLDHLIQLGWVYPESQDKKTWCFTGSEEERNYLMGSWLEEMTFCAHEAAGVDEAYFGQDVEWHVNGIRGENEIDVLARRGDMLSFTSCKTIRPERSVKHLGQLRAFLSETDYWNIHFANDRGRALLVTTADFYDEKHGNALRYPGFLARASVLEVSPLGLENLQWPQLVERIHAHWNQ